MVADCTGVVVVVHLPDEDSAGGDQTPASREQADSASKVLWDPRLMNAYKGVQASLRCSRERLHTRALYSNSR